MAALNLKNLVRLCDPVSSNLVLFDVSVPLVHIASIENITADQSFVEPQSANNDLYHNKNN